MRSGDEYKICHPLLTSMAALVALILLSGCAHSPDTITLKTPHGSESIKAPSAATLFSIARILEAKEQYAESERMLRSLLASHADFLPAYNELAGILMHQRRIGEAYGVVQAGLKAVPSDPVLLNNAGMCQLLMKNYATARDYFGMAGAVSPENARYRANLALSLALQGKTKEAQAFYETILPPEDVQKNLEIIGKTRLTETQSRAKSVSEEKNN